MLTCPKPAAKCARPFREKLPKLKFAQERGLREASCYPSSPAKLVPVSKHTSDSNSAASQAHSVPDGQIPAHSSRLRCNCPPERDRGWHFVVQSIIIVEQSAWYEHAEPGPGSQCWMPSLCPASRQPGQSCRTFALPCLPLRSFIATAVYVLAQPSTPGNRSILPPHRALTQCCTGGIANTLLLDLLLSVD